MSPVFGHGRLRLYLLKLLGESPRHGYEVIRLLQDRFLGVYAPSPGTIYPRLARMEKDGLIAHEVVEGRKVYRLTDAGRRELDSRLDELAELEEELTASVRDIAREVRADVRETVRSLRDELTAAARDMRRDDRDHAGTGQRDDRTGAPRDGRGGDRAPAGDRSAAGDTAGDTAGDRAADGRTDGEWAGDDRAADDRAGAWAGGEDHRDRQAYREEWRSARDAWREATRRQRDDWRHQKQYWKHQGRSWQEEWRGWGEDWRRAWAEIFSPHAAAPRDAPQVELDRALRDFVAAVRHSGSQAALDERTLERARILLDETLHLFRHDVFGRGSSPPGQGRRREQGHDQGQDPGQAHDPDRP